MPRLKGKRSKYISYLLRFTVAGAALYLAFRGESLKQVGEVLLGLSLWIFIAALAIYIASQLIFVFRWFLLLKALAINISFHSALKLHFLGLFYNNCLPGSVGGDFLRAWYITKHTDKKLQAALSVFVDRAIGLFGMFIMAFFSYWFIPTEGGGEQQESRSAPINLFQYAGEYKWVFIGIGAAFAGIMIVFLATARGRAAMRRYLQFIYKKGILVLGTVYDAILIYWNKKLFLFAALLLTFCCQGVFIIGMVLIGSGLGIHAQIKYYFIFFPVSWLLGTLPISVGGAGIMEWWLKIMFMKVCAVSSGQALALALCQRFVWLFGSLPGAVIHTIGAHLPKDFFIDGNKSVN
jgi:uncharacterized protein (TIRG00374 family)